MFQHEVTELDDKHGVASDVTEGQDEKGETTNVKDGLEYYVNGNASVSHNRIYSIVKNKMRKNVSRWQSAEPLSLLAVTSRLALVGAELPVVKFADPGQVVCDIIGSRVYTFKVWSKSGQ